MRRVGLVFLMVMVALMGTSAPVGGQDDKKFTFPMNVGTVWTYIVGENRFEIRLTKMEKIGKVECARLEMFVDGKSRSFEHLGIDGNILARHSFEGKPTNPPIALLKLPPKPGEKWNVESKLDGQLFKGTLAVSEELVQVPAGKYTAIKVSGVDMDLNGQKFNVSYWFASGVGMVKQVSELAGQKVTFELEKFSPGK
ncbi:MAG: hypothetical protein SNJ82_14620 [Gemmataceae bacterium]